MPDVGFPPLRSPGSKPLEGVRMIRLTRTITGSVGGRLLFEMGVTTIRVIDKSPLDFTIFQVG
jgi:crotonobetainyl-CoA:carnitine CoA-transferase CaiB-like acyl-CoA transferase